MRKRIPKNKIIILLSLISIFRVQAAIPEGTTSGLAPIALGSGSSVDGDFGISIGVDAASKYMGTAIGIFSESNGQMDIAIGAKANTQDGSSALAIGTKSNVSSLPEGNTSVSGKQITKNRDNFSVISEDNDRETLKEKYGETYGAIAIGHSASALADNSVAVGDNSIANRENTLSVGNTYRKRQITNVASGTEENDAVNVSQLNKSQNESIQKAVELINNEAESRANADKNILDYANNYTDRIVENGSKNTFSQAKKYTDKSITSLKNYTDSRFKELKHKLDAQDKKFERGLASSAAISGLFQPYTVGTFNMTVGIGGYRDESAVAVGTGYRFNNNIAAKAGMAASTGDSSAVMYNASVNFEW
ncbi:YadA-like family protein [Escherichia coli]